MKPANYQECLENNQAQKQQPDPAKAQALRKTAQARKEFLNQPITQKNANFIFEGLYTSLVELLHAHLLDRGVRIKNHICIGYYVRDKLQDEQLHRMFNDLRYKRNALVYYGEHMPEQLAKQSITEAQQLMQAINTA